VAFVADEDVAVGLGTDVDVDWIGDGDWIGDDGMDGDAGPTAVDEVGDETGPGGVPGETLGTSAGFVVEVPGWVPALGEPPLLDPPWLAQAKLIFVVVVPLGSDTGESKRHCMFT